VSERKERNQRLKRGVFTKLEIELAAIKAGKIKGWIPTRMTKQGEEGSFGTSE